MPFNGAGTFTRLYSWVTDKANGIKIIASRVDAEMDGMATGLSNAITRDGQSTITAPIPFNNQRITGLGDATADDHALSRLVADARFYQNAGFLNLTAAYTVLATDRGKTIRASGTFTLALTAAATLGPKFTAIVRNTGAGTITIDPNGTEAINGSSVPLALSPGSSVILLCDGTAFTTVGDFPAGSLLSSGYQRLPSGLIFQWGTDTSGTSDFTLVFPVAFSAVCFAVVATQLGAPSGGTALPLNVDGVTTTQFNIRKRVVANGGGVSGSPNNAYWFAVGF